MFYVPVALGQTISLPESAKLIVAGSSLALEVTPIIQVMQIIMGARDGILFPSVHLLIQ